MEFAHVEKGKGLETATQIFKARLYVNEDNTITVVTSDEANYLLSK